jgi:hypothetical protein
MDRHVDRREVLRGRGISLAGQHRVLGPADKPAIVATIRSLPPA